MFSINASILATPLKYNVKYAIGQLLIANKTITALLYKNGDSDWLTTIAILLWDQSNESCIIIITTQIYWWVWFIG